MDFDSPDVEKDFPGLYASETGTSKKKEESDFSEGDHEKISKKDLLIGRRKDKKDLRYATLQGSESSSEEELETKSPSKSTKKSKAFIFTTSKSKEKREKSRDKSEKDGKEKDTSETKEKEKDKKKDKDKEKDKKEKVKDKDKDKKSKQDSICEEVLELGDILPIFGVSVSLATERSHCHDGIDLPLVVRDCIDYLQEQGLQNDQIYKVEPEKSRLQSFKRLYNNRETQNIEEFDVSIACGLLKLFLRQLPEPILTTDLITSFEEAASHNEVTQIETDLKHLLDQLPRCNKTLLSWILLHFDSVIQNEKYNKMNAQSLAMLLSPTLKMSHRLLVTLLCHCRNLFPKVKLIKSPSKSTKKSKAFKFTTSKGKEKDTSETKEKEKDKKKDKDKKEKDKKEKVKDKDKDKKDKKSKQASICEEVLELGDVQPVFGVSVSLATERSHCHDGIDLPLVVRDCIDYLQEQGLQNDQIYKVEPMKSRLQSFKRLYNNRETQNIEEFDVSTACGLLKLFLRELPEPILTTDLITRFEEAASHNEVTQIETDLKHLLDQLPRCNKTLLSWILLHFDSVIQNEKYNKMNAQSLAMLLSPPLQMSHRLLVTLLCHCPNLFPDVKLIKYIPPITSASPKLPEGSHEIQVELKKQESLLTQIHSEMNAGFFSKKREEQLWEVQRIITQLKRKLRSFEKRQDTIDGGTSAAEKSATDTPITTGQTGNTWAEDNYSLKSTNTDANIKVSPQDIPEVIPEQQIIESVGDLLDDPNNPDKLYVHESGLLMVPESHPSYTQLIKLQLENQELLQWKSQLQARINAERAELLKIKKLIAVAEQNQPQTSRNLCWVEDGDYEKVVERYIKENNLLEQKKQILAQEIFEERRALIQLQVDIAVQALKA